MKHRHHEGVAMRRLRTPEDIENLNGYVAKVDPLLNPLSRIIDHYYIRPFEIQCGLCGRPHMDGCIVELTDRKVTNIGHICGAKFGDRFDQERRKNYDTVVRPRLIQAVSQAQAKFASDQFRLHEIRLLCNDKAILTAEFGRMFPSLFDSLKRRAANNRADVSESEQRSKEEIEDLMAANPFSSRESLAFKETFRGTIRGFKFPLVDWSMSGGLRQIFNDLEKFIDIKPRNLSVTDLQRWAHWAEDFDGNLARVTVAIAEAENFFSSLNFQLFAFLVPSNAIKVRLRSLRVQDIGRPIPISPQNKTSSLPIPRKKPARVISAKELRRLTGNKKAR
jgi:Fe-S-cluster formation regulator IscX/YfhJ